MANNFTLVLMVCCDVSLSLCVSFVAPTSHHFLPSPTLMPYVCACIPRCKSFVVKVQAGHVRSWSLSVGIIENIKNQSGLSMNEKWRGRGRSNTDKKGRTIKKWLGQFLLSTEIIYHTTLMDAEVEQVEWATGGRREQKNKNIKTTFF